MESGPDLKSEASPHSPVHRSLHPSGSLLPGPQQVPWLQLRLAGGGLGADGHPVHLFQVAEVDSDVAEHLRAEFAAHEPPGPGVAVMQPHVCAQAARPHVGFAAEPAAVGPPVAVRVGALVEVLLGLEGVLAHVASVRRLLEAGEPTSKGRAGLRGGAVVPPAAQMLGGGEGVIERRVLPAAGRRGL